MIVTKAKFSTPCALIQAGARFCCILVRQYPAYTRKTGTKRGAINPILTYCIHWGRKNGASV